MTATLPRKVHPKRLLYRVETAARRQTVPLHGDAGIVDEDVQMSEIGIDLCRTGNRGGIVEIDREVADTVAFEPRRRLLTEYWIARPQQNSAARRGELLGHFEADTFVRSGNESDFLCWLVCIFLTSSRFEGTRVIQIFNQPRQFSRMPSQPFLRQRAGSGTVDAHEEPEEAKMLRRRLRGHGDDRHFQTPADCLSDLSQRHALFVDRVIPGSRRLFIIRALLQREPVERGSIQPMHRGPAVEPVAYIRRDTFFASHSDQVGDEALLVPVMDLREAHHRRAYSTRRQRSCRLFRNPRKRVEPEGGTSSSVATRPGAMSNVPEVTTRGRSEPSSAEPSASMARLSISQFAANFEKSWLKAGESRHPTWLLHCAGFPGLPDRLDAPGHQPQ